VIPNCSNYSDSLVWTDPDYMKCSTNLYDVVAYRVYFTPVEGEPFHLIYGININSIPSPPYHTNDTIYRTDSLSSIAGCYVVTSIDSSGNESVYSNEVCVDNCPVYTLPNVFSPNGDGVNDYFKPFPYKFVKSINLDIYDRWGLLVFTCTDPEINWDGKDMTSHLPVSDGTYFYLCIVNEIHYEGIISHPLKGFIQVIQNKGDPSEH
jgi:gliding motility-associated-like protein